VLAGCSSSPKSPPVPKTATTTSTTATTLPPATTTTAAQAAQPCTTTGVSVTSSSSQGAAGTLVQRFIVTNTTAAPCGMNGAPFISPYGPQPQGGGTVEADLPITVGPIPAGFGDLGGSGGQIVVAAGQTVFQLRCAPCHGSDRGADPSHPLLPGTDALRIKYRGRLPALLEQRTDLPAPVLGAFVRHGTWSMPPFRKTEISDADIDNIAAYLAMTAKRAGR